MSKLTPKLLLLLDEWVVQDDGFDVFESSTPAVPIYLWIAIGILGGGIFSCFFYLCYCEGFWLKRRTMRSMSRTSLNSNSPSTFQTQLDRLCQVVMLVKGGEVSYDNFDPGIPEDIETMMHLLIIQMLYLVRMEDLIILQLSKEKSGGTTSSLSNSGTFKKREHRNHDTPPNYTDVAVGVSGRSD
ncbi:hypothetical protein CEXT_683521 [Caerostris extrusa]|uniref:Uncharacterized protein n=1 Tax=Caerostris extrusa TaxID=172846 RepID=A0AAV4NF47_CAEEX|nr:hypothetical protein CEXT_683521 [Caerostris extrusa]